jgi:threonine dehydrogenase-like Zn-dependent dehydrogenase
VRAFQIAGRGVGAVVEMAPPVAAAGQVVVEVARAGLCGTDASLFSGDAARISRNRLTYPIRPGHEWSGTVTEVGSGVDDAWLGRRVTADTLLGCGVCDRCRDGRHHLCGDRWGIGVRRDWPGALAEQVPVAAASLRALPDSVSDECGALVEPGANAVRAVEAAGVGPGSLVLVVGPGSIGLLAVAFAIAAGAEQVHVVGVTDESLALARGVGAHGAWRRGDLPARRWDAVIDATNAPDAPAFALEVAEVGRRVVLIGVSPDPSHLDSRRIVHKELQVFGVLGGSLGLDSAIAAYARHDVDPVSIVAETVGLDDVNGVLSGTRERPPGGRPKVLVDPRR